MTVADEPFVFDAWLKSHRQLVARKLQKAGPMAEYRRQAERLINEYGAIVAHSPDQPSVRHGFICASPTALHYVYVPRELRCMGLGQELIRRALGSYPDRISCTHQWPWKSGRFIYEPERRAA